MPEPVPLILDEQPAGPLNRGLPPQPGRALVFSKADGSAQEQRRRPSFFTAFALHHRYEVDVSHHFMTLHEELPSRDVPFFFRATVEVGWRVSEPARIVQARIEDGVAVVRSRLLDSLRPLGRGFGIEECHLVEAEISGQLGTRDLVLPEGITVFRVSARVFLDDATTEWLGARRGVARQGELDSLQHHNRVASARNDHLLSQMHQRNQAELEQERMEAVRAAAKGEDSLLLILLARHPDQIHKVIDAVAQRREMTTQAQLTLFNKMVDKGFIQEADVEPLRQLLLQPLQGFADSGAGQMFGPPQLAGKPPLGGSPAGTTPGAGGSPGSMAGAAPGTDAGTGTDGRDAAPRPIYGVPAAAAGAPGTVPTAKEENHEPAE